MSPSVAGCRDAIIEDKVVFPAPLAPSNPKISPLASWKDTPLMGLTQ